jgi:hypothetical protein
MLGNVTSADVHKKITEGMEKCDHDQGTIANKYRDIARMERLKVRQDWAADRKKLQALLDVLELEKDNTDAEA